MHYVLAIPCDDAQANIDELFASVGCAHIVEGRQTPLRVKDGPNSGPCLVFYWMTNRNALHKFEPDRWVPAVATEDGLPAERYFIGVKSDALPTPVELQRRYPMSGDQIVMGDGQAWIVPREYELPHQVRLADDGSIRFEPQRRFHEMHILSNQWRGAFAMAQSGHHFVERELCRYVDHALSINYRTLPELTFNVLNLYTTSKSGTVHPALAAALSAASPTPVNGVSDG